MTADDPARHDGTKRRLFFSFSAQTLAIGVRIAIQLLMVPIFLHGWDTALYQDWLLIFSATGFLSILDLGMQVYFSNALLADWSRQDMAAYRRHFGTALALYAVILSVSAGILSLAALLAPWSRWLGTTAMTPQSVVATLCLLTAASLILIPAGLLTALYRARGEYGLSTASGAIAEACRGGAMALIVLCGGSPADAGASYLLVAILFVILVLWDQRRRYGAQSFAPTLPDKAEFREALTQSMRYLVAGSATPILQNAPILLLGRLGTEPGAVVAFAVFRTLTGFARQIVTQLSHAVGGELGHRHSRADIQGTATLMSHAGRLVSGAGGLLCGVALVLGKPFLAAWTQGKVGYDPWLCGIFLATILICAPAQVAYMVFHYTNRPTILLLSGGLQIVITLLLCALLIGPLGAAGAALACAAAETVTVGLLLPLNATRSLDLPVAVYLRTCLAAAGACSVLSAGIAWGLEALIPLRGYPGVALIGVIWCILIAGPAFRLLLSTPQRDWVLDKVRRTSKHGLRRGKSGGDR